MNRKQGRIISVLLIAFTLAMALVLPITSAEREISIDVDKIVNTTTDQSLVESPFTAVAKAVQESVVGINNYQNYSYSQNRGYAGRGRYETVERLAATGSGVVFYEGYVITNYHVVEDAARITVSVLGAQEEIAAEVVAFDESIDVAIVYAAELTVPAVPLGDSDSLQVGEWAICIGNPLSDELRGSVTVGIVSALDRQIQSTTTTDKYGLKTSNTNSMIQTDAAINSGNSGGGMFNVLGQLMGIPTLKYAKSSASSATVEGIGMAIPINSAKPLIAEALMKGLTGEAPETQPEESPAAPKNNAATPRLGITASTITRSNNYAVNAGTLPVGAMVNEVEENSPAANAGMLPYDVIVEVEGNIVTSVADVQAALLEKHIGDSMSVKVYRPENIEEANTVNEIRGAYKDLTVALTEWE